MIDMHMEMAVTSMQTLTMYCGHGVNSEEQNRAAVNRAAVDSLNKATTIDFLELPIGS
jgi:hypothetical protein